MIVTPIISLIELDCSLLGILLQEVTALSQLRGAFVVSPPWPPDLLSLDSLSKFVTSRFYGG